MPLGAVGGGWGPHALVLPILLIWGCFVVAARQALWMRGLWGWGWGSWWGWEWGLRYWYCTIVH
jgi:hypothetical protein